MGKEHKPDCQIYKAGGPGPKFYCDCGAEKVQPAPAPLAGKCPLCHGTMRIMEPFEHPCSCDSKWQPAPLPGEVECAINNGCIRDGGPENEWMQFPAEDWQTIRAHISDLTRRLADAEAERDGWREQAQHCAVKRVSAEARVRRLEVDNAGRFDHIVKVEAERDALREALRQIASTREHNDPAIVAALLNQCKVIAQAALAATEAK